MNTQPTFGVLAVLACAGLYVVVLDAGPNWNPQQHSADEVEAGSIYWTQERLSGENSADAFGANSSGTGVGGSTLH